MPDDGYTYELVTVYKYPASNIGGIGGPGFDSGWVGNSESQTRVIISQIMSSPCSLPCDPIPLPI